MDPEPIQQETAFDSRVLSDFIYELNIARRCGLSYPAGHPRIQASVKKVLTLLGRLLEFREKITLGIARDVIVVGKYHLDKKNPVYRDYAKSLFQLGIATLTIDRNLTEEEFLKFNLLLGLNRERLKDKGGLPAILKASPFDRLGIQLIDYALFQVTEAAPKTAETQPEKPQESNSLWEEFIQGLLEGTVADEDIFAILNAGVDPAALARVLNEKSSDGSDQAELQYDQVIVSYIRHVFEKEKSAPKRKKYLHQLNDFVLNLNPNLRRLFLTDIFRTLALRKNLSPESLSCLSKGLILEAFEKINPQSPFYLLILGLLQKLALILDDGRGSSDLVEFGREKEAAISPKVDTLLRDFNLDLVMEKTYQQTLQNILAAEPSTPADSRELEDLKATLDSHTVDVQISSVILEILKSGIAGGDTAALERNLGELCGYFLQIGDFQALIQLHTKLEKNAGASDEGASSHSGMFKVFSDPDFISEILNGVEIWGKDKFPEIKKLICKIGRPFLGTLLDRLAEEPSLTIRRFLLETLSAMAPQAKEQIIRRIYDRRWYFIRNLLVILRSSGDPTVLPLIRNLRTHEHPRVREEVLKTLFIFKDPEAERFLLDDLRSLDLENRRNAVQIAEMSQSPSVFRLLLEILDNSPLNGAEGELRQMAVRTLGKIGNPAALPHLERVLRAKSFFKPQALSALKGEILRSLEFYPPRETRIFLERVVKGREKQFAPLAVTVMEKIRQRSPA
jgi:hypothetical protein